MNKRQLFFSLCFLIVFTLCSCSKSVYDYYETKNYSLSNSHIENNIFKNKNGTIEKKPYLPSGLFICYDKNTLPYIDYQKRREDIGIYPIYNVSSIYESKGSIIVLTNDEIKQINPKNPNLIKNIDNFELNEAKLLLDSNAIDLTYFNGYVQNAFSLQDKRINKKYKVNYSTPVINGITKIGLYNNEFYFGETLYSYFVLNIKTDDLVFFTNKNEFDIFCKENISHSVMILEAPCLYE